MESDDIPDCIAGSRQEQLVFFTGLDVTNNQAHQSVFSAFTRGREPDRPPLRFVMLSSDHTFLESKTSVVGKTTVVLDDF